MAALPALLLAGMLGLAPPPEAAGPAAARVKAELLDRFARFTEWPADSMPSADSPFVMCVLGRDDVASHLDTLAAERRIAGRRVEVRSLAAARDALGCQVLWLAESEGDRVDAVLRLLHARPVLTVAGTPGWADRGLHINIVPAGARLGFEVNLTAARRSGVRLSSKLLKLASRVIGSP